MSWRIVPVIVLGFSIMSCSYLPFTGSSKIPESETRSNFVYLFDGEDLDSWVVMGSPAGFQVADGVIHSDGGKGGNWMRTKREYGNFMLRMEFRVSPGGNSGVFFRCPEEGNPWETGYECQISNEQPPRDDMHCTGSLYGYVAVEPRPDESPEVWHTYEILAKNSRIIVFVDGRRTVNVNTTTVPALQGKPMTGYIGLQDSHSSEGSWVEFRNIRVQELK